MGDEEVDHVEHKFDVCCAVGCAACALLFIIIPASIIAFVLNTPFFTEPDISSKIHSFSISLDIISSTALCDVALSLRKNKACCKNLYLNIVMASVYYKKDRIWTQPIPPFGLPQREQIDLRFNLTAWLPDWAAEEFRYGRALPFDVKLEGVGSYDEPLRIEDDVAVVKVLCDHFKAEYASDSAAVQLVHSPVKCEGSIDN